MVTPNPDGQIAAGRTSVVIEHGDDHVVKLLRPGFDTASIEREASLMSAARDAGAPVPASHGQIEVDGRPGLILDRVDGELLSDEIALDPMRYRQWARTLAATHADILSRSSSDLPRRIDLLAEQIERADVEPRIRSAALDVLGKAPDGDTVLHGDFHPGNLFVTRTDPVVIDWADAARGHPSADIARTLWLLTGTETPGEGLNRRVVDRLRKGFVKQYLTRVTRTLGVNRRLVEAWRLPILTARVSEGIESEEATITAELRRLIG